jgi:Aerotolerance regulator N-terminal
MTFLNATLMFGMAAIAVPIVLHLLARREPRKVVFPSVAFLTKRFETNRSRLQVRRWWLLALRIAALAALALALARPAIHRSLSITWLTIGLIAALGVALLVMASVAISKSQPKALTYTLSAAATLALLGALIWGGVTYFSGPAVAIDNVSPVAIAIVLDNSPTSAWKTAGDDRMGRMKELATWMVTRLPPTSRIAIVDRSGQPASFSLDVASAISKIEQLRPRELVQPVLSRLDAAARLVRTSDLPVRQVLLITDLTKSTWAQDGSEASIATTLSEDPEVALTVFDLGECKGANRSLAIPKFDDTTPALGAPIALSTVVSMTANDNSPAASVTVELEVYDNDPALPVVRNGAVVRPNLRSVDRSNAALAPGGSSELLMTIPALETGVHHGRIRLIGDDAMPLDDERYFTLTVSPASRVLLVCDDEDESQVMTQVITASAGMLNQANAEFDVERIEFADLSVVRLADFAAVLLIDPAADVLADESIAQYVGAGGGLLVCLGPAAGVESVQSPFLPTLVRRWNSPDPGTFFEVLNFSNQVTQHVSKDTPWADFRVQQYWQLETTPTDAVLIGYSRTAHAAVVQRTIHSNLPDQASDEAGRVLVFTTPLPALAKQTRAWNDLFGSEPWPAWLLTRQSMEYLARREGSDAMSLVGQPQTVRLAEGAPLAEGPETDPENQSEPGEQTRRVQLFPPGDATPIPLNVPDGARQITTNEISQAGTYWLRGATPGAGFSVNTPEQAIQLERIEVSVLDQLLGTDQYRLATNREEIEFAESESTERVSLHSPAMLLVLIVFLLEQVLGNRFYRRPATT